MFKRVSTYAVFLAVSGIGIFVFSLLQGGEREKVMLSLSLCLFGAVLSLLALVIEKRKVLALISFILSIVPYLITFLVQK